MVAANLDSVRRRIAQACQRRGRPPSQITLIGVTKGIPVETIRQAQACGLTDVGENRVQEARSKQEVIGMGNAEWGMRNSVRWHLIGHLQRNKAKDAAELFDVIHSVDSVALAKALERHAPPRVRPLEALIQVNVSGEATKFGCTPEEAAAVAQAVMRQPHLRLVGLMTIAPFTEDPERSRPHFRCLRELRDALNSSLITQHSSLKLSMGMSQDFEVAIEEGADVIRVGTAIFGPRNAEGHGAGDMGQGKA